MKHNKNISQIINILRKLVVFRSFDDNFVEREKAFVYIDRMLEKIDGLKIARFNSNKFPSRVYYFNNKQSQIHLNGHIDVVKGENCQYTSTIKRNRLSARGSYDMKTACAAFLYLFLKEPQLMQKKDVALVLVSDEEISGRYGTDNILKQGYSCHFVINGEPTELQMVREVKGNIHFSCAIHGISAHVARPWLGENPIYALTEKLTRLLSAFPEPKREIWKRSVVITNIETKNSGPTSTPTTVIISGHLTVPPNSDIKRAQTMIDNIFLPHKVQYGYYYSPIYTKRNNTYIKKFERLLKNENVFTGYRRGHGTADLLFYTKRGIPGVGFGIKGGGAHGDKEWVDLNSVETYFKILKKFISMN